ncbi:MAG: HlyD family secretion protein [Nitrospinales bacterium]
MKKYIRILFLFLVVVAGIWVYTNAKNRQATDTNHVFISGNIEVTDAEVSFKIAGRVLERLVSEGETIQKGQLIARLENADLAQEVALRKAEAQAAKAKLDELLAGSRPEEIAKAKAVLENKRSALNELLAGSRPEEIAAAEATVEIARADMENLKIEAERYKDLYQKGIVSAKQRDEAVADFEMAQGQVKQTEEMLRLEKVGPRKEDIEQARADLNEAQEEYNLVKKGPREELIEKARAELNKAKAALSLAEIKLGYAELSSPLSGIVLSENIEAGEYVTPGTPIVTVGDLEDVWIRGYVNETDLGRVKVGQKVRVTTDTYPGKTYEGLLSFIASQSEFTPKNVQTEKERVKLVYRVKITIHNPEMELKPGMPADAEILLE